MGDGRSVSERPLFARALEAYERGEFFAAHEHWEDLWRVELDGDERLLLQALIQIAAAMHKRLVMKSAAGAIRLLDKADEKIARVPEATLGFDLASVHAEIDRARAALRDDLEGRAPFTIAAAPRLSPGTSSRCLPRG